MCKCQRAHIIYAYQSFKGGERSILVQIILNIRPLIPKFSGLLKVVSQKNIWLSEKYKGDHRPNNLEFQRKLGPRAWRKKGQLPSLSVLSAFPTRSLFPIDKPNNFSR